MSSSGTSGLKTTQENSQWMVEACARASQTENDLGETSSYASGQHGHINLLEGFNVPEADILPSPKPLPSAEDRTEQSSSHYSEEENGPSEDLFVVSQTNLVSEPFPESRRFQIPRTPASTSRKRWSNGQIVGTQQRTPSLPSNPFDNHATREPNLMGLSQVFRATQAPTSPLQNGLFSDTSIRPSPKLNSLHQQKIFSSELTSEKQSPNLHFHNQDTPSNEQLAPKVIRHESSPFFTQDPPRKYRTRKESQEERRSAGFAPYFNQNNRRVREISDSDFIEFAPRTNRPTSSQNVSVGPRREETSAVQQVPPFLSSPIRKTAEIPRNPPEELDNSSSDVSTEREAPLTPEADLVDELGDDNKENINQSTVQVPRTSTRLGLRVNSTQSKPESSPSGRVRRAAYEKDEDSSSQDELASQPSQRNSTGQSKNEPGSSSSRHVVAIADSQEESRNQQLPSLERITQPNAMSSSERNLVIPQSQDNQQIANTPGPTSSVTNDSKAQNWARDDVSISDQHGGNPSSEKVVGTGGLDSLEETVQSQAVKLSEVKSAEVTSSRAGGTRGPFSPSSATSVSGSADVALHNVPSLDILAPISEDRAESGSISRRNGDDCEEASSPLSPLLSSQSGLNDQNPAESPLLLPGSRSVRFAEIAKTSSSQAKLEDIDLDIGIMTAADLEFKAQMDAISGSSPVPPSKKRRLGGRRHLPVKEFSSDVDILPIEPTPNLAQNGIEKVDEENETSLPLPRDPSSERMLKADSRASPKDLKTRDSRVSQGVLLARNSGNNVTVAEPAPISDNPVEKHQPSTSPSSYNATKKTSIANPERASDGSFQEDTKSQRMTAPRRIFAQWSVSPAGYYPATCLASLINDGHRYKVRFDDGTSTDVAAGSVRRLELLEGDLVKVDQTGLRNSAFSITKLLRENPSREMSVEDVQATDIFGNQYAIVCPKKKSMSAEQNLEKVVPVSKLYLTASMWSSIKDRSYTHIALNEGHVNANGGFGLDSSTALHVTRRLISRESFKRQQAGLVDENQLFYSMSFVITGITDERIRARTVSGLEHNGGRLLEHGFKELFDCPSIQKLSDTAEGASERFKLRREASNARYAILIADRHCRTPKYFQALALGVPCLATRWVRDCIKAGQLCDWRPYLLASGESVFLDGAICSRQIDFAIGSSLPELNVMLGSRRSLFKRQKVVLVGEKSAMDSYIFLSYALGAKKVELLETDKELEKVLRGGNSKDGHYWDWIVKEHSGAKFDVKSIDGVKQVGTEFVVQSLILGTLLDSM